MPVLKQLIYPNPASNQVNLTSSKNIKSVIIYNHLGQNVLEMNSDSNQVLLNTSNLKSGVYTVQITTESGNNYTKLIIE